MKKINIFWFRRDLRLHDNHGLFQALSGEYPVLPLFIFDTSILQKLPKNDHRVSFIHFYLNEINQKLATYGSSLQIEVGSPLEVYGKLIKNLKAQNFVIEKVFANHDYEPYAFRRDEEVEKLLSKNNIQFETFKDQVIFEKNEVTKEDGSHYTVFTPYSKKWLSKLKEQSFKHYVSESKLNNCLKAKRAFPALVDIGFRLSAIPLPGKTIKKEILLKYKTQRDYPSLDATTHLGVHLRFGTVSVRDCVKKALEFKSETWLSELIWREFFMQILWHNPYVVDGPFKEKYAKIKWRNNESEFAAWCEGRTGYPIVDAGMRELNTTGFMHNRVRMIVGSFLVKHLLIDWSWGEKYFAEKLFDFDLSANNGNWQWVAGCGCDAAPYFRIFNPHAQTEKFDKDLKYIRKWVPEFQTQDYASPIVEHVFARKRCLEAFSNL